MSEPLLRIKNRHTGSCSDPPILNNDDPALYIGYFENSFGEQWIFTFDRKTQTGLLRGGDVDWNSTFVVDKGNVPGLNLRSEEIQWLRGCWKAASGL